MPEETENVNTFLFTLGFRVGGVIDTGLELEEARSRLQEDLSQIYGQEGFEILEFRTATEDEVAAIIETYDDENPVTIN